MKVRYLRLYLGLFFLFTGAGLLVLRFAVPDAVAKFDPLRVFIGAILALILGGVNLAKWYAEMTAFYQQATPVRKPFQPDPEAMRDEEPNPDFDFSKKQEER